MITDEDTTLTIHSCRHSSKEEQEGRQAIISSLEEYTDETRRFGEMKEGDADGGEKEEDQGRGRGGEGKESTRTRTRSNGEGFSFMTWTETGTEIWSVCPKWRVNDVDYKLPIPQSPSWEKGSKEQKLRPRVHSSFHIPLSTFKLNIYIHDQIYISHPTSLPCFAFVLAFCFFTFTFFNHISHSIFSISQFLMFDVDQRPACTNINPMEFFFLALTDAHFGRGWSLDAGIGDSEMRMSGSSVTAEKHKNAKALIFKVGVYAGFSVPSTACKQTLLNVDLVGKATVSTEVSLIEHRSMHVDCNWDSCERRDEQGRGECGNQVTRPGIDE